MQRDSSQLNVLQQQEELQRGEQLQQYRLVDLQSKITMSDSKDEEQLPPVRDDDRPPPRRSRSRSPPSRRRMRSRSRSRSYSRSRSPAYRGGGGGRGGRSRSPSDRHGGGSRSSRRRSSRSPASRSPSPPVRGGRYGRDRDHRDRDGVRGRGPPGPRGYGPPDDHFERRGGRGGPEYRGGPPPFDRGPPPVDVPRRGGPPPPPFRGDRDRGGDRRRRGEGMPGVSLLVRNVGPQITTQDLQMAFGRIGSVRDVYVPRDYFSQQPKGFAFIEYASLEMAREARDEMDRFRIKGCELEVVFAQERRKTPNEMRGRDDTGAHTGGSRDQGKDGGGGFERSSSFERMKQRRRDEERRRDQGSRPRSPGGDRSYDEANKKSTPPDGAQSIDAK